MSPIYGRHVKTIAYRNLFIVFW